MSDIKNKRLWIIKTDDLIVYLYLLITIIIGLAVNHGDSTLSTGTIRWIIAITIDVCVLLTVLLIFFWKHIVIYLIYVPILYWIFINVDSYNSSSWNVLLLLELVGFCNISKEMQCNVFSLYKKYLVIMAAIGIICYMAYVLTIPLPHITVPYYSSWQLNANYVSYGLCYLYTNIHTVRLCGLFNEPGYLGTVLALVLCADKINLKKKENIILLIAGCMTFSAAFYAILIIYITMISYKRPKIMTFLIVLLLVYFLVLPNATFSNEDLNYLISRFTFSNGTFLGDNRSKAELDSAFNSVLCGVHAIFGHGGGYVRSLNIHGGVSSYKSYVVDYGIFGACIIYIPLIFEALKRAKCNLYAIFFCVCFLLSVYQRPSVYTLVFFVLLFGGIQYRIQGDKDSLSDEVNI